MTELTIGMATYDDFDGVYFSVQDLRLHHDMENVEILVVDNFGCDTTAAFVASTGLQQVRYIRYTEKGGTAAPRQKVFEEARGQAVLCMDSHVLFAPGAIARLKQFYREHPETMDLYQGPMVDDALETLSSHFDPVWGSGMYGKWGTDPRVKGDQPFEIGMQGLGSFSCRKEAWLGFNPAFRGFGGEEYYIHEKFRQAGRRCWCLPWLRWLHRFGRPKGVPYPLAAQDTLANYLIGWDELGLPLDPVYEHFMDMMSASDMARTATEALGRPVRVVFEEGGPLDVPYVPSPQVVVDRMLEAARVTRKDVLYDLGCGDGRIVCTAAEKYRCKAFGFDIDPQRLRESARAKKDLEKDIQKLVTIREQNLFDVDLGDATVLASSLLPETITRLTPKLLHLAAGTRVMLHNYPIEGVQPDEGYPIGLKDDKGEDHYLYRYTAPIKLQRGEGKG
jgi:hypothetical protein